MGDTDESEEGQPESTGPGGPGQKMKKIGHRRVDSETGAVSYKRIPASGLMVAMQLGIGQAVGYITPKERRDILMKDFDDIDVVHFPAEGSATTVAHRCKDFVFKTYAPRAFRYFREEFEIGADDFLVSLCTNRLKELSNPGASGSLFFLSHDDNFILKTVQRKEAIFLQKLLPGYYINLNQNKKTTLPKFYGSFQYESMGKNIRILIMNNILPSSLKYHEKYDLKGSTYKRQASQKERQRSSPTLKDLDFIEEHHGGLVLEPHHYKELRKILETDIRVLESFRIMDYSLLLGIHNLTLAKQETIKSRKPNLETRTLPDQESGYDKEYARQVLDRIGSKRVKDDWKQDPNIPQKSRISFSGGIPAVNEKGEHCLLFLGIIDILQNYRFLKKFEHSWKSIIADGDTVSVHRPSFYAERFKRFCFDRVFKCGDDSSPHLRRNKSAVRRQASINYYLSAGGAKVTNKTTKSTPPSSRPPSMIQPTDSVVSNDPGPSGQDSAPTISLDNVSINVDDKAEHSEAPSEELKSVEAPSEELKSAMV